MVEQPFSIPPPADVSAEPPWVAASRSLAGQRALREALRLAARGYVLVPVTIGIGDDGKKAAKFHVSWSSVGSSRPDVIRDWSVQHQDCSYAVLCGPSGIEVVDLDLHEGGPAWWVEQGLPVPDHIVDTPSGGQHHWWRRRPTGEPSDRLVNNAGKVAPGVDARTVGGLVFAPGSYVVGREDRPYTARTEIPDVDHLAETPRPVLALWSRARVSRTGPELAPGEVDQARRFTQDEAVAYVQAEAQRPLLDAEYGQNVNDSLNRAALVVGHFVPEFFTEADARAALRSWLLDGPGRRHGWTELDGADRASIDSGLRRGRAEPYARRAELGSNHLADGVPVTDPHDRYADVPMPTVQAGAGGAALELAQLPEPVSAHAALVQRELVRIRAQHEARDLFERERRANRPAIADGIVDDLTDIAPPIMLMGSLIPEDGIGFLAGRSGSYKSFLATSWAACIATGTPWLGRPEFRVRRPLRTLYVAAEGRAGAAARLRSWEAATGRSRLGALQLYGKPIRLNDPGAVEELGQVVRDREYQFLVIDTLRRSMPGTEDNSATEFGLVFEAVARLRDEYGCAVLLVDHTGHAGDRLRGSSAKGDDADYVLTASYSGNDRSPDVQRTLSVSKLKDEESVGEWPIRLDAVSVAGAMPVVGIGQVVASSGGTLDTGDWSVKSWTCPETLSSLQVMAKLGASEGVHCARDMLRVLEYVGLDHDMTDAEFVAAFGKRTDGGKAWTKTSVKRGRSVLLGMDLAVPSATGRGIGLPFDVAPEQGPAKINSETL